MPIYKGNIKQKDLYHSSTKIKEAYYGGIKIFSGETFIPETRTFNYTGDVQTYTVPTGCTKLIVDCVGAAGGGCVALYDITMARSEGGRVQCKLAVSPGQILYIYVGESRIVDPTSSATPNISRTFGGGGAGSYGQAAWLTPWDIGAPGGGASDIRIGGTSLNDRKVVAGGGGGVFINLEPGAGGGLTGGDSATIGTEGQYFSRGKGGTQSAGGAGALVGSIRFNSGSFGQGADGGATSGSSNYISAGGGGGWYGGGAGGCSVQDRYTNAGGGSSYTDPNLCTDVIHTQGYSAATGNGWITITTSNE